MAKFAGLEQVRPAKPAPSPIAVPATSKIGRPSGKRSDAAMEPANLFLGKRTKYEAKLILERRRIEGGAREDLSMLVERLLRAYIAENAGA